MNRSRYIAASLALLIALAACHGSSRPAGPAPDHTEIFIVLGFPATLSGYILMYYLYQRGATYAEADPYTWYFTHPETRRTFTIYFGNTPENLARGLTTEGAVVIFFGHSNIGLGMAFSYLLDHQQVSYVHRIEDFFNVSSDVVGTNWRFLKQVQAFPNLEIAEEEIVEQPENYVIPYLDLLKFENIEGVRPGERFFLAGEGIDRYHYRYELEPGKIFPMLVVKAGHADLPGPLRYKVFLYHGCSSGYYYSEQFQHGVFFYTTDEAYDPVDWEFLGGILDDLPYDQIKANLNRHECVYDYYVFPD